MRCRIIVFFFLIVFLVFTTGCVNNEKNHQESEIRIVTTYSPATDMVLSLSGKDNLVAVDDNSIKSDLLKKLHPKHELIGIGSKKNGINIEQIISLNPDVVILYPTNDSDDTMEQLEHKGIKVVKINPETMDLLKHDIFMVGKAIGKEKEANELIAYMNTKLDDVINRVKDIINKKNIYLAGARGVLSTCSGSFYQHEIITLAGGYDFAEYLVGGWNEISVEQLVNWNPDVIITVNYSPDNVTSILDNQLLSSIKAINEGQVYEIPSNIDSWDLPKPSSILGILWMGKTLYPDKFTDIDLMKETNDFYTKFYGQTFEELGGTF
ncbi:ABC transporter substrate-binding protein [Mycoplasmatota bacterium]|nr:ABC transporter substrate-binding protein [Mycoplasmatota bacterium]